jgi:choline kinase
VGGEPLLDRSLRLLCSRGVVRTVLVTGFQADTLAGRYGGRAGVEIVRNDEYRRSESFWSLHLALELVDAPFLLLESDLFYDASFLDALEAGDAEDAMLISTATISGDEVWAGAEQGRLTKLSKTKSEVAGVCGEIVGISRFSQASGEALRSIFRGLTDDERRSATYDTTALNLLFALRPIGVVGVSGALWGEIDHAGHYRRVVERVLPAVSKAPA